MRPYLPALALLLATAPLAAHVRARQVAADKKVHKVQKLAENVYCIVGEGGNIGLVVTPKGAVLIDRKSTRLNSSHIQKSRMPSSA